MSKQIHTHFGKSTEIPPLKEHVAIYFIQQGLTNKEADYFFNHHQAEGWRLPNGKPIKSWKTEACEWIWNIKQNRKLKFMNPNNN